MTDRPFLVANVSLVESRGRFHGAGRPTLFCTLNAAHLPGTPIDTGRASVIARDPVTDGWREDAQETTNAQAGMLLDRLGEVGLFERAPEVVGVVDTSDSWVHLLLHVATDERSRTVDLSMQSSGFAGGDAGPLRALLRTLFGLAGYEGYDRVVYGSDVAPAPGPSSA